MIRLENVSKVYRTDRIETLALDHVNPVSYTHLTLPTICSV